MDPIAVNGCMGLVTECFFNQAFNTQHFCQRSQVRPVDCNPDVTAGRPNQAIQFTVRGRLQAAEISIEVDFGHVAFGVQLEREIIITLCEEGNFEFIEDVFDVRALQPGGKIGAGSCSDILKCAGAVQRDFPKSKLQFLF